MSADYQFLPQHEASEKAIIRYQEHSHVHVPSYPYVPTPKSAPLSYLFRVTIQSGNKLEYQEIIEKYGCNARDEYGNGFVSNTISLEHLLLLKECGVDIDMQDIRDGKEDGNTKLLWKIGNCAIKQALAHVEAGADLSRVSLHSYEGNPAQNHNALTLAVAKGYDHISHEIGIHLMSKAKGDKQDCISNILETLPTMGLVIDAMLQRPNKDDFINHQEVHGWSPLHFAAMHRDLELMSKLIKAGCNPYLKDLEERSAIDILSMPYEEVADKLLLSCWFFSLPEECEWQSKSDEAELIFHNFYTALDSVARDIASYAIQDAMRDEVLLLGNEFQEEGSEES